MDAATVVIDSKRFELSLQIKRIPEENVIEILAPQRADQPFDERMRYRYRGHRLDFVDFKYTQISEPPVKAEEWIMVSTDVLRRGLTRNGAVKHPTNGDAVDVRTFHSKANDAAGEYIHHDHDPMAAQQDGFAAEHIEAP